MVAEDGPVLGGERLGAVEDDDDEVGGALPGPGAGDPCASIGSSVGRRPAVSATSTGQAAIAVATVTTSRVVPGVGRDDRAVVAGQGVQEPTLAHVRPTRQDHPPAVEQPDAELPTRDQLVEEVQSPVGSGASSAATTRARSASRAPST